MSNCALRTSASSLLRVRWPIEFQTPQQGRQCAAVQPRLGTDLLHAEPLIGLPRDDHHEVLRVGEPKSPQQRTVGAYDRPTRSVEREAELAVQFEDQNKNEVITTLNELLGRLLGGIGSAPGPREAPGLLGDGRSECRHEGPP